MPSIGRSTEAATQSSYSSIPIINGSSGYTGYKTGTLSITYGGDYESGCNCTVDFTFNGVTKTITLVNGQGGTLTWTNVSVDMTNLPTFSKAVCSPRVSYTQPLVISFSWVDDTVSFNKNDTTLEPADDNTIFNTVYPATGTYTHAGITYNTITITNIVPTRPKYYFLHWNTTPDDTDTSITPGMELVFADDFVGWKIVIPTGNNTLYAIWKQYTLSFHTNYPTQQELEPEDTSDVFKIYKGYQLTVISDLSVPSYPNYNFKGWSASRTGSVIYPTFPTSYSITEDVHFYAVWEPVTFNITYYDNLAGKEVTNMPSNGTTTKDFVVPTKIPICIGYNFLGWDTNQYATIPSYLPGQQYTISSDLTLYAIWSLGSNSYLYINGSWKIGIPYQYTQNGWKVCLSYIYENSWRQ